jgi:hypothetical protein
MPFEFTSDEQECLMLVFYQRDKMLGLDNLECEECRKDFLAYSAEYLKHRGTGEPKWAGSYSNMWASPEWIQFKVDNDMEHCSNTNYYCLPDVWAN